MKAAIKTHNLYKNYGNLAVLTGLSLEVFESETLVIIGRSGVGKSVLLRLIMGLENPDEGYIMVNGRCQSHLRDSERHEHTDVGMLFQSSALFDSLSIQENVAFPLTCRRGRERFGYLSRHDIAMRVDEALELVGLSGTQEKMPSDLSGGMKRRAALARLIVYRPSILLYDEPTTGLDPVTAMQINELIVMIQVQLRATSIVVTHDLNSALSIGDRLALHHEGKIACVDDKDSFLQSKHPLVMQFLLPSIQMFEDLPKTSTIIKVGLP